MSPTSGSERCTLQYSHIIDSFRCTVHLHTHIKRILLSIDHWALALVLKFRTTFVQNVERGTLQLSYLSYRDRVSVEVACIRTKRYDLFMITGTSLHRVCAFACIEAIAPFHAVTSSFMHSTFQVRRRFGILHICLSVGVRIYSPQSLWQRACDIWPCFNDIVLLHVDADYRAIRHTSIRVVASSPCFWRL